jgi:type IV secretion system protein VirD4
MAKQKPRLQSFEAPRTPLQNALLGILVMVCFMVLSSAVATQYFASRMNYSSHLGAPAFSLAGRGVYVPFEWISWGWNFVDFDAVKRPVYDMTAIALSGSVLGVLSAILVMFFSFRRTKGMEALHGDAHWATTAEVDATGMLARDGRAVEGLFVGSIMLDKMDETVTPAHEQYLERYVPRMVGREQVRDKDGRPLVDLNPAVVWAVEYLRDDAPTHTLVFAPTRSMKGVGLIIPTLFGWRGSAVVSDQKGENYALTAGMRRQAGQRVGKFAPTSNDGSSWKWNPLDEIRKFTPRDVGDAQNICSMIVDPDAEGMEEHFISMAWRLLTGLALHHVYAEKDASLAGIALYLADPNFETDTQMWQRMLSAEHDPELKMGWVDTSGKPTKTHPFVAAAAKTMLNTPDEERGSVRTTTERVLSLWMDPLIAENTRSSDFLCRDLMTSEEPVSLYYIPTEEDKDRLVPLTRLFYAMIIRRNTVQMEAQDGRMVGGYKHRLLMLLDEFPALRKMEIIQDALAYVAGYGIKIMLICQDLRQLQGVYGENETIVAGCHVRIAYGPTDERTAKRLEEMVGQTTVAEEGENVSANRIGMSAGNISVSRTKTGRALMTQGEWLTLSFEDMVIFVANNPPIYGRKIKYYEIEQFAAWSRLEAPTRNAPLRVKTQAPLPARVPSQDENALAKDLAERPVLSAQDQAVVDRLLADHFAVEEIMSVKAF